MIRRALLCAPVVGVTVLVAVVEHNRAAWYGLPMGVDSWVNVALAFLLVAGPALVYEAVILPWPPEACEDDLYGLRNRNLGNSRAK